MKPRYIIVSYACIILVLVPAAFIQGGSIKSTSQSLLNLQTFDQNNQDGRFIEKLQWYSPNGELPGTYNDYLKDHPITMIHFSSPSRFHSFGSSENHSLAILIDETLYPAIETKLNQYINDLSFEGYEVYLQQVSGGTPEDIKAWIHQRYEAGNELL